MDGRREARFRVFHTLAPLSGGEELPRSSGVKSCPGSEEADSDPPPATAAAVTWEVSGHAASGDHPGGEWLGRRGV